MGNHTAQYVYFFHFTLNSVASCNFMLKYNGDVFVVFLQKSMFMISNNGGKSNNDRNTF
jgi:hypothetical protein